MEAMTGGVRKFPERISNLNDKQGRSAPLDCSSAHDEEVSHVPIGKAFCMWDVASRKVCMELVVSELEGHGTTRNCMPKDIKIRRGERCTRSTDARDILFTPTLGLGSVQAEKRELIHKRHQDLFLGEIFAAGRRGGPFFRTSRRTKILRVSRPARLSLTIVFVLYALASSRMSIL